MYDVIRQPERIGENHDQHSHLHHQQHQHQSSVHHTTYHPASFRRIDPRQAYSLYGLYASDAVFADNRPVTPTTGIYRSSYSPVSPGAAWTEYIPAQRPAWSKPVIIDTVQWSRRQRQYDWATPTDVSGAYRHASVISTTPTTITGTSGLQTAASMTRSPGLASSSVAASVQRQHHCAASRAHSSVTSVVDDDDVTPQLPASPHSATYQPNSTDATSNVLCLQYML